MKHKPRICKLNWALKKCMKQLSCTFSFRRQGEKCIQGGGVEFHYGTISVVNVKTPPI